MKASELIAKLHLAIEKHGDLQVMHDLDGCLSLGGSIMYDNFSWHGYEFFVLSPVEDQEEELQKMDHS